jgi:ribosome-associated protein
MPDREEQDELPSKSALKRHMHHLQSVGESLLALNDRQLAQIPIEDEQLLAAIRDCRKIRSNSARKRQLQFIGKLMRGVDAAPIEQALATLHDAKRRDAADFHRLEKLREDILALGLEGIELAVHAFPTADRQHLRNLVLQHQREVARAKPPAASRKLFRYLKELQETQGDAG